MRRISIEHPDLISLATAALKCGGVVVLPTDTLYGLSTPLSSGTGHQRVVALKGVASERKFLYLASSVDMVAGHVGGWGCTTERELAEVWPAALTAILPSGPGHAEWIGDTIAFRVPLDAMITSIVELVGEPILSTSVNRSGEPPLDDAGSIADAFGDDVDLIVERKTESGGKPSTLVDFTGNTPRVIRRGGYAWATRGKPSN